MRKKIATPEWIQAEMKLLKTNPMLYFQKHFGHLVKLIRPWMYEGWILDTFAQALDVCKDVHLVPYDAEIPCINDSVYTVGSVSFALNWYEQPYLYGCTVSFTFDSSSGYHIGIKNNGHYPLKGWDVSDVKVIDKLTECSEYSVIVNKDFNKHFPYARSVQSESGIPEQVFYFAPHIEQLYKAGYVGLIMELAEALKKKNKAEIDIFNRLTRSGTDIKSIFKTEKPVYRGLRDENVSLKIWDVARKMVKGGKINADAVCEFAQMGLTERDCGHFYRILGKSYRGTPIFTFNTLVRYLTRLDVYEALDLPVALEYLDDYLQECDFLGIKPNIESDSLLREHNIAARLCRETREERRRVAMDGACKELQKWNYSDGTYLIRGVQSFDDLLDEAKQQHNCVACYADQIAKGNRKVYLMRRLACPDKSLITVEISKDGKTIRQKYLARNMQIRNPSQQDFLQNWLRYVAAVESGKIAVA